MIVPREIRDVMLYFYLIILLLFLQSNFDFHVSTIYYSMAVFGAIFTMYVHDKGYIQLVPAKRQSTSWLMAILYGLGAYLIFNVLYGLITKFVPGAPGFSQMVVEVFATARPILEESLFIKFSVWGFIITIIETMVFFVVILMIIAKNRRLSTSEPFSKDGIMIVVFTAAAFTLFHITAKGVSGTAQLMATFVFGLISGFYVLYFKEAIQAIIFHIATNVISLYLIFMAVQATV